MKTTLSIDSIASLIDIYHYILPDKKYPILNFTSSEFLRSDKEKQDELATVIISAYLTLFDKRNYAIYIGLFQEHENAFSQFMSHLYNNPDIFIDFDSLNEVEFNLFCSSLGGIAIYDFMYINEYREDPRHVNSPFSLFRRLITHTAAQNNPEKTEIFIKNIGQIIFGILFCNDDNIRSEIYQSLIQISELFPEMANRIHIEILKIRHIPNLYSYEEKPISSDLRDGICQQIRTITPEKLEIVFSYFRFLLSRPLEEKQHYFEGIVNQTVGHFTSIFCRNKNQRMAVNNFYELINEIILDPEFAPASKNKLLFCGELFDSMIESLESNSMRRPAVSWLLYMKSELQINPKNPDYQEHKKAIHDIYNKLVKTSFNPEIQIQFLKGFTEEHGIAEYDISFIPKIKSQVQKSFLSFSMSQIFRKKPELPEEKTGLLQQTQQNKEYGSLSIN